MNMEFKKSVSIGIDKIGRPMVESVTFENLGHKKGVDIVRLVIDTGAGITTMNKLTADLNKYEIVESEAIALFGFNDAGLIVQELSKSNVPKRDIDTLQRTKTGIELKRYLLSCGINQIGLIYDLRKINTFILGGFVIENVIVATPHDDNTNITEVLGMNVLSRFHIGFDFMKKMMFLSINETATYTNPKYMCGGITLAQNELPVFAENSII